MHYLKELLYLIAVFTRMIPFLQSMIIYLSSRHYNK